MSLSGFYGAWTPVLAQGVEVPILPAIVSLLGLGFIAVFFVQAFRSGGRPRRPRPTQAVAVQPPAPVILPPTPRATAPAAPPVTYKKAPVSIHFPQVRPEFPDVWGVGEAVEIVFRIDDKTLASQAQIPTLKVAVAGEPTTLAFSRGVGSVRRMFPTVGERTIVVDFPVAAEPHPRRTQRHLRIVEYRTEIADVFTSFREEASRAITPIREDATPWEIYDILTSANPNLPQEVLREIISSFEEAKFSNHPVTRATYERMINALLQLERVEL